MTGVSVAAMDGCKLEIVSMRRETEVAVVTYDFENGGSSNVYLFHRLHSGYDGHVGFRTDVNLVYVELDGPDVVVSKKVMPVPPNIAVEMPVVPLASRVAPQGRLRESVRLPLPLKRYTPYGLHREDAPPPKPVLRHVFFEVGYYLPPSGGDELGKTVEAVGGPGIHFYPFPASAQRLLRVGPLSEELPVLVPR